MEAQAPCHGNKSLEIKDLGSQGDSHREGFVGSTRQDPEFGETHAPSVTGVALPQAGM